MKNLLSNSTGIVITAFVWMLSSPFLLSAQFSVSEWDTIPFPYTTAGNGRFVSDTTNNSLFFLSSFVRDSNNAGYGSYLLKYENGTLSPYANFSYAMYGATFYKGSLIVCGGFDSVNGVNVSSIAQKNASGWSPFGWFRYDQYQGKLNNVKVIEDTLYTVGGFNVVDGDSINGIARLVSGKWEGVYEAPFNDVGDVCKYKGVLYVGGNMGFIYNGNNYGDMAMYKNGEWQPVGPPYLSGGFTHIKDMTVYNDELYVLGWIQKSDGNVGNGIQKWDGTQWSEVGSGLQSVNPGYGTVQPFDMEVHNGKLYVVGGFYFAGDVPARFVATWDGDRWCSMNSSVFSISSNTFFNGVGFLNDTLFCGFSGRIIEGNDSAFYQGIVKAPLNLVSDTCSINFTTGVEERNNLENGISVYPNPATNLVNVKIENANIRLKKLELINAHGQVVLSKKWEVQVGLSSTIELNQIAGGVYVLKTTTDLGEVIQEIIVIQR